MPSTWRLWTPEARARKRLKLVLNTILATMRHGCSIQTAMISRSFIKAELIFIGLLKDAQESGVTSCSHCQRLRYFFSSRWHLQKRGDEHEGNHSAAR